MKKINWLDHLINLVVVIGGITIAFTMDNWKEARKEAELEKQYAQSFVRDLTEDISKLDSTLYSDSIQLKNMLALYQLESIHDPIDSLDAKLIWLGTYNNFYGQNITYESLKSSGKLEELWTLEFRMAILNNYHNGYGRVYEIDSYFKKNFDENVLPYFINEMIFKNVDRRKEQVLEPHFKNILALHISFLNQKMGATKELRSSTRELLKRFERMTAN